MQKFGIGTILLTLFERIMLTKAAFSWYKTQ